MRGQSCKFFSFNLITIQNLVAVCYNVFGSIRMECGWQSRNTSLLHLLYPKCGRTRYEDTCGDSLENVPLASRFSASLNVVGTGADWSTTCDFLLVIQKIYGHIAYCFRYKRRNFCRKSQILPVYLTPTLRSSFGIL